MAREIPPLSLHCGVGASPPGWGPPSSPVCGLFAPAASRSPAASRTRAWEPWLSELSCPAARDPPRPGPKPASPARWQAGLQGSPGRVSALLCGTWHLWCGVWDPVPRAGTSPAPGGRAQRPSHWTAGEVFFFESDLCGGGRAWLWRVRSPFLMN